MNGRLTDNAAQRETTAIEKEDLFQKITPAPPTASNGFRVMISRGFLAASQPIRAITVPLIEEQPHCQPIREDRRFGYSVEHG